MAFDSILNGLWLLLGLLALAATLRISCRTNRHLTRRRIWQSCAVVALVIATLFPFVSATDDVLRIQNIQRQSHTHSGDPKPAQKPSSDALMRLYESMDTPLIAAAVQLFLILLFICVL